MMAAAGGAAPGAAATPVPPSRPPFADTTAAGALPRSSDAARAGPPAPGDVPLPPSRPPDLGAPQAPAPAKAPPGPDSPRSATPVAVAPSPTVAPALPSSVREPSAEPILPGSFPVDQMDAACTRVLASGKVLGARQTSIVGPDGCGIAFPLELRAIVLADGRPVRFDPPPILRCDLAETLADWIRTDIAPLGTDRGALVGVKDAAAYMCRGRNNVLGAPMSEHGRGDAIDLLGLDFAKAAVPLRSPDAHDLWAQVKTSACLRFSTVLGPGSDGYHETNLHLDLENRRNGTHYCHWDTP